MSIASTPVRHDTEVLRAVIDPNRMFLAVCTCGWEGRSTTHLSEALDAADNHSIYAVDR